MSKKLGKKSLTPREAQLRCGPFRGRQRASLLSLAGVCWLGLLGAPYGAAAEPSEAWDNVRGAGDRIAATWRDQQVVVALERVVQRSGTPLWIDRRVNRQQLVTLTLGETATADALQNVAAAANCEAIPWQGIAIIAPQGATDDLATLALRLREQLAAAPPEVRRTWLARAATEWPQLTEPRQLLLHWLGPVGLSTAEANAVPHDLLDAGRLPPMARVDRAALVLSGFDLTMQFDSASVPRIVPIVRPVRIEREYRLRSGRAEPFERVLTELQASDRARIVQRRGAGRGRRVTVAATAAGHDQLAAALVQRSQPVAAGDSSPRRRQAPAEARRYTLTIERQPLGPVLDQLGQRLGVQFAWSDGANAADYRQRRVSCHVRDATQQELLAAIVADAQLTCQLAGNTAMLSPADR